MVRAPLVCATALALACGTGDEGGDGVGGDAEVGGEGAGTVGAATDGSSEGGAAGLNGGGATAAVRGQTPPASGGIPAIVTLTPQASDGPAPTDSRTPALEGSGLSGHPAAPAEGGQAVVDQFGLAFSPRVLIVAHGSPVRFTNSEGAISHNVHLRSVSGDSTVFNGDTGPTEEVDVMLPDPGGYDVLCDMHPGMTGFVFITDAPLAVAAGSNGRFEMDPVPPGEYLARVWTVEGWGVERVVELTKDMPPLDLTRQ